MPWLLNPANPHCKPTRAGLQRRGIGSGDVSSVAVHWVIDVELKPDEFHLFPEAAGRHVLYRKMVHDWPTVKAEDMHFDFVDRAFAMWESRPLSHESGIRWRLAYNYYWGGFGSISSDPPLAFEEKAWTLWFAPEYWRAVDPNELNIAFPLFSGDELIGRYNAFQGVRPNELRQYAVGNNVIPGVVLFPDFPATLTVTPWWP